MNKTKEFIKKSQIVHGYKYDYSKTVFIKNKEKVCITCPIHGDFYQLPDNHLHYHGCPKCKAEKARKLFLGIGHNDIIYSNKDESLSKWESMLHRCYSVKYKIKYPTYNGCTVCDEWLYFSNFKKWFDENYVEGYHIDKDILVKGNKVYSPETCCFVPQEINKLLTKTNSNRGKYPIGVYKGKHSYLAFHRSKYIASFHTIEEAFNAYKSAKEQYIKELAEQYFNEGKITKRVYDALMKYEVEITD